MFRQILYAITGKSYAASIGIIGGADGPTAIFVTKPPVDPIRWILSLAILAAVAALILLRRKK